MKHCRECSTKLTPDNTKGYRLKNYVYLCNDCDREKKMAWEASQDPKLVNIRSKRHQAKLKAENPTKYTARQMYSSAQKRAKAYGWEFNLTTGYLETIAPTHCPVFGTELKYGGGDKTKWSASLDRIDSSGGYTTDNVMIMSALANRMKADATTEEMNMFADWIRNDHVAREG